MDEAQTLDALANALTELSEKPLDISLHAQHVRLAQSVEGAEIEQLSAFEMLTDFLAAGESVWFPLLRAKEASVDLTTANGVGELLALYDRAEADYLSIPILVQHLHFLIDKHSLYSGEDPKPTELGEVFSTDWTRTAIHDVVSKGTGHLTQSHLLWDLQRDWELEMLERASPVEKRKLVEHIDFLHLARLRQPHSNSDDTFQSYSSFTTNHKPAQEYETLLVAASKIRAQGVKSYTRREPFENALVQTSLSLDSFANYLAYERRSRNPEPFVVNGVFERAIAEAAKRRFDGQAGAEAALRAFWVGYCDSLRVNDVGKDIESQTLKRAMRSVPGAGEVWARYMRYLERAAASEMTPTDNESVTDIYMQAINTKLLDRDIEQIVPVVLARVGYERRKFASGNGDEDTLATLIGTLEAGIDLVRQASKLGDMKFRLEKYLADIYQNIADLPENALMVWKAAAKHSKSSYQVWLFYTDLLINQENYAEARKVFVDIHLKQLDWPEAIWEAWIAFEHAHGSVDDIDSCLDKVEKAQNQVNARRMKEAEKAMQAAYEQQSTIQNVPIPVEVSVTTTEDAPMDVDAVPPERGTKRNAEDEPQNGAKKVKIEPKQTPLKRDRENCTVFVADLPDGVSEDELAALFKDCGKVREVKITQLPNALVATVEFFERESIPAALTKDKKRIRDQEVAVHLAWKSTLYVTNFPESADDAFMRDLFGNYGIIFDVRWPSKKFKSTRRFCYVQYTSPTAAGEALVLHGRELEPGYSMSVLLSNPERKKERTDHDANEREIYVAGLSKYTTQVDLEKLFKTYGTVKEVRMTTDQDGKSRGFAFVEFEDEKTALAALDANNHELKKRRIAVTLADSRVRSKNRADPETGLSRLAEVKSRSVRVRNLPAGTQEGLLQQALEKTMPVKRVEVFADLREAVIEFANAADAGKVLLRSDPVIFNEHTLSFSEESTPTRSGKSGGLFVPRTAVSKPRLGLGHPRKAVNQSANRQTQFVGSSSATTTTTPAGSSSGKGQDDFRRMLGNK